MEKTFPPQKPGFFYGYWIVAAAFCCLFIFGGLAFYAFSPFVIPLQTEFGWSRGGIMTAVTILFLVSGIASPYIGRLVDRYGARMTTCGGALVTGLGFASLNQMHSIWHFYISYTVIALGLVAIGPVPVTTIISNWFKKRRGTAMGIMSTGIGAGGVVMAPVIGGYLIPSFGWRASYLIIAAVVWTLIIPLALLVIRTRPADKGLYPDGIPRSETNAINDGPAAMPDGVTLKTALASPTLWLIGLTFLFSSFAGNGAVQHQVPYLEDTGFSSAIAAGALGGVGLGSIVGKLFFGWLCDRIGARYVWFIALTLALASIVILMTITATSPVAILWLYAILIGMGLGGYLPVLSILVSSSFGLAAYGAIFGMANLLQSIGIATGPMVAGYMYDAMGSYHWVFILFIAICVIAIFTTLMLSRAKMPYGIKPRQQHQS